jgi:hypothetical protein
VTATIERKIAALRAHESQIKDPDKMDTWIRTWAADEGKQIGVDAAEALRVVVIEDDESEGPAGPEVESAEGTSALGGGEATTGAATAGEA